MRTTHDDDTSNRPARSVARSLLIALLLLTTAAAPLSFAPEAGAAGQSVPALTVGTVSVVDGVITPSWEGHGGSDDQATIEAVEMVCYEPGLMFEVAWDIDESDSYDPGASSLYAFHLTVTPVMEEGSTDSHEETVAAPGTYSSTAATAPSHAAMPSALSVYAVQFGGTHAYQPSPGAAFQPQAEASSDVRHFIVAVCDTEVQDCGFYFDRPESTSNSIQAENLPQYPGTVTPCELIGKTVELVTLLATCPTCGAQEELDYQMRISETLRFVDETCSGHKLLYTAPGNGGSWMKIYQGPARQDPDILGNLLHDYQISFFLQTNNIANGADEWVFGAELTTTRKYLASIGEVGDDGDPSDPFYAQYFLKQQHATCQPMGTLSTGPEDQINAYVDAGATGWLTSSECTVTLSWEVKVGVKVGVTGPETDLETTLGGSASCGDGSELDTESLLRGIGTFPANTLP